MEGGPFRIIVLEDNRADLRMIQESIREAGLECAVTSFSDGAAAIEHVVDVVVEEDAVLRHGGRKP